MEDSRIIKVTIEQDDIKRSVPIAQFQQMLGAELSAITFQSKLFSTKGTVDREELQKEINAASSRVIQTIRDAL